MLEKMNIKSEQEMISDLIEAGIRVEYLPKALVPQDYGTPMRNDIICEEMDIFEAHRKICQNPMRNYDPFSK